MSARFLGHPEASGNAVARLRPADRSAMISGVGCESQPCDTIPNGAQRQYPGESRARIARPVWAKRRLPRHAVALTRGISEPDCLPDPNSKLRQRYARYCGVAPGLMANAVCQPFWTILSAFAKDQALECPPPVTLRCQPLLALCVIQCITVSCRVCITSARTIRDRRKHGRGSLLGDHASGIAYLNRSNPVSPLQSGSRV